MTVESKSAARRSEVDQRTPPKSYYPQIDSLRVLAAFSVINLHWLGEDYLALYGLNPSFDWGFGQFGVQLFFVLSGFLITDILINLKERQNKGTIIKNFLVRRALRLFPVYYLLILFLVVVKDPFVIENIGWFLTYTSNIKFYLAGGLVDVWSNHLWTLSIEEQFYLIFPLMLLFTPATREYFLPVGFILLTILTRNTGPENEASFLLTWAQTDMLGIGILIALIKKKNPVIYERLASKKMDIAILLILIFTITAYYYWINVPLIQNVFPYLLLVCFGLLVIKTAAGFGGFAGRFFENRFLRHLGKISYGLYLYHKVIPLSLVLILNKLNVSIDNTVLYYVTNLVILLLISQLSWVLIESPMLRLKRRFEYQ